MYEWITVYKGFITFSTDKNMTEYDIRFHTIQNKLFVVCYKADG